MVGPRSPRIGRNDTPTYHRAMPQQMMSRQRRQTANKKRAINALLMARTEFSFSLILAKRQHFPSR
jgi:hypothetical protein